MIIGLGIDTVEVQRIQQKLEKNPDFVSKVFSINEIVYCEAQMQKAEHYAARFAAKEAFLKAIGLGLMAGHELSEIEVFHDNAGKPSLKIHEQFQKHIQQFDHLKSHVSLTHTSQFASAVVILES